MLYGHDVFCNSHLTVLRVEVLDNLVGFPVPRHPSLVAGDFHVEVNFKYMLL